MKQTTKSILERLGACSEAVRWAGKKTPAVAWRKCHRADWMLWVAGRLEVDWKLLVLAACDCARTALKYVPEGDDRPRIAIETAEARTRGEATLGRVRRAAYYAAYAADYAYYAAASAAYYAAYAAHDAAYAAYDAAYAAYAAHNAAHDAAYAANAAHNAAYAAAYAAANAVSGRKDALKRMAALVRKRIPYSAIKAKIEEGNDERA